MRRPFLGCYSSFEFILAGIPLPPQDLHSPTNQNFHFLPFRYSSKQGLHCVCKRVGTLQRNSRFWSQLREVSCCLPRSTDSSAAGWRRCCDSFCWFVYVARCMCIHTVTVTQFLHISCFPPFCGASSVKCLLF